MSEATCLNNIAEILSDQGRYDEARTMLRRASRTWRSIGYSIGIAYADSNLGRLASRTGRHVEAVELLVAAADRFAALGSLADLTEVALRTIEARLVAGDPVADDVWPADTELEVDPTLQAYADRLRALAAGSPAEATPLIDRSIATARAAGVPFELALVAARAGSDRRRRGGRHRGRGDLQRARSGHATATARTRAGQPACGVTSVSPVASAGARCRPAIRADVTLVRYVASRQREAHK